MLAKVQMISIYQFGLNLIRYNWDFYCLQNVGYNRGFVVENGKNMLGVDRTESIENVARRINTPNEDVADMPLGTEYIIRRGLKPIRAQRYAILNDREYQAVTRRYELDIQKRKEKRKQFLENFEIA